MKTLTQRPLHALIAVFILPFIIALSLSFYEYRGNTVNKGTWIEPSQPLSSLIYRVQHNTEYTWNVIYLCDESCILDQHLPAGLSTLGVKNTFAKVTKVSSNNLTPAGQAFFHPDQIYLSDPKQNIILSYPHDKVMDLVADLKRLLKPIEKRA